MGALCRPSGAKQGVYVILSIKVATPTGFALSFRPLLKPFNPSTFQLLIYSTPQLFNFSTFQLLNFSSIQLHLNGQLKRLLNRPPGIQFGGGMGASYEHAFHAFFAECIP